MDIGRKLQEMFGTRKVAKDPAAHRNPNARTDPNSGDQSTSLAVTVGLSALSIAKGQQASYAPVNTQDQVAEALNTPTAQAVAEQNKGLELSPYSNGEAPSPFPSYASDNSNRKGG